MTQIAEKYIRIKRRLFDAAYADLNPMQRKAVFTVNGPLLVIAGAGSGKTTVLVRRIAQIIRYGNAYMSQSVPEYADESVCSAYESALSMSPDEIMPILGDFTEAPCAPYNMLAITFTNKAANEIKERLAAIFNDKTVSDSVWAGTFHSVCMRIIRSCPERLGFGQGLTIYDTDDQKKLLTSVMKDLNIDDRQFSLKNIMAEISRAKEQLKTPEAYSAAAGGFREKVFASVYGEYQARLGKSNALDFDDIIMQTVLLLRRDPEILDRFARKFRYICVDEYQDTNYAQFELCRLLASVHGNIMVVGDDDQSIYRFRGATVENILGFDKAFADAEIVKLEQNYRSTSNILNAANCVIARNPHRHEKTLWTKNGEGKKIVIEKCNDGDSEARKIVDLIQDAVAGKRHTYRDFGILYRVNAQSNSIERTFAKSGIPYRICGGQRFSERKEIKDVVAYLQVVNNPGDRIRLKRIINEPRRKIGETTVAAVEALSNESGRTMLDVMAHADEYLALARSADRLKDFAGVIASLRAIYDDGCPLDAFVGQVLDRTGYRQMLIDGGEAEKDRLDNVEEFISNAVEYMNRNDEPTLDGFLEENALVSDIDSYDETADACVLMTIHSAKGLEFPVAVLPGMEEGLFPGIMSIQDPAELEEERRLAYVAITRAKQELYIFYAGQRLLYGKTNYTKVSRFVDDIPDEYTIRKEPVLRQFEDWEDGIFSSWGGGKTYVSGGQAAARENRASAAGDGQKKASRPMSVGGGRVSSADAVRKAVPKSGEIFAEGERVVHPTFGPGEIMSVKVYGADTMYEIAFDNAGTKKLMASFVKLTRENR